MSLVNQIIYVLLAILLTTMGFASLQKSLGTYGIVLAVLISVLASWYLISKWESGSWQRLVGITIAVTVAFGGAAVVFTVSLISYTIDKAL